MDVELLLQTDDRDVLMSMVKDRHGLLKAIEWPIKDRKTGCPDYGERGAYCYKGEPIGFYIKNYGDDKDWGRIYAENEIKTYCRICGKEIGAFMCPTNGSEMHRSGPCYVKTCGYFDIVDDFVLPLGSQDLKEIRNTLLFLKIIKKKQFDAIREKKYHHWWGVCKKKWNIFDNNVCEDRRCRKIYYWWHEKGGRAYHPTPNWEPTKETKREYLVKVGILIIAYYLKYMTTQKTENWYGQKSKRRDYFVKRKSSSNSGGSTSSSSK